jgi:hypothetical protein
VTDGNNFKEKIIAICDFEIFLDFKINFIMHTDTGIMKSKICVIFIKKIIISHIKYAALNKEFGWEQKSRKPRTKHIVIPF